MQIVQFTVDVNKVMRKIAETSTKTGLNGMAWEGNIFNWTTTNSCYPKISLHIVS